MLKWRRGMFAALMLACLIGVATEAGRAEEREPPRIKGQEKDKAPTTAQAFMRDKLAQVNQVLGALAVEDFDKVSENATRLRMLSRAASWYVFDSDEYTRYSKNFQEQASDLERHAKDKNLDAAALDYVRLSMTCIECHKYVRAARQGKKTERAR
jgi:cytochrome c556